MNKMVMREIKGKGETCKLKHAKFLMLETPKHRANGNLLMWLKGRPDIEKLQKDIEKNFSFLRQMRMER